VIESLGTFRLARVSPLILVLTMILLAIPVVLLGNVASGRSLLAAPALLVIVIYSWVWLRFRPSAFIVRPDAIEVEWPLKRRRIHAMTSRAFGYCSLLCVRCRVKLYPKS